MTAGRTKPKYYIYFNDNQVIESDENLSFGFSEKLNLPPECIKTLFDNNTETDNKLAEFIKENTHLTLIEVRRNFVRVDNTIAIINRSYLNDTQNSKLIYLQAAFFTYNENNHTLTPFKKKVGNFYRTDVIPAPHNNRVEDVIFKDISRDFALPDFYEYHSAGLITNQNNNYNDKKNNETESKLSRDFVIGLWIGAAIFVGIGIATGGFGFIGLGIYAGVAIAAACIPVVAGVFTALSGGIRSFFKKNVVEPPILILEPITQKPSEQKPFEPEEKKEPKQSPPSNVISPPPSQNIEQKKEEKQEQEQEQKNEELSSSSPPESLIIHQNIFKNPTDNKPDKQIEDFISFIADNPEWRWFILITSDSTANYDEESEIIDQNLVIFDDELNQKFNILISSTSNTTQKTYETIFYNFNYYSLKIFENDGYGKLYSIIKNEPLDRAKLYAEILKAKNSNLRACRQMLNWYDLVKSYPITKESEITNIIKDLYKTYNNNPAFTMK